ncbi:MAG: hypothetical protein MHM6MM_001686 [Cercozoa sp. M6MM]
MVTVSPEFEAIYEDVMNVRTETNFVAITPEGKNNFTVAASGTGGYDELKQLFEQNTDKVYFAALQITGIDEQNSVKSERKKSLFIVYIGSDVSVMKRARVSVQSMQVRNQFFGGIQLTVEADLDTFTAEEICGMLLRSGGAHKPKYYICGPSTTVQVEDL